MKIIFDGDSFTIFVLKKDNIVDMTKYMKNLILKIRRKYKIDVSGFYNVDVYLNDRIGLIAHFIKEDELEFFRDIIDLKVTVFENALVYLEFEDYFLRTRNDVGLMNGKYYVDIDNITEAEFFSMIEFSRFVFGDELEKIRDNIKLVVNN